MPDLIEIARQGPIQDEGGEAGLHGLEFWALRNGNLQLRDDAVEALVQIGVGTEVTVPHLIERFVEEGCLRLHGTGRNRVQPACEGFAGPDRWSGRPGTHRRADRLFWHYACLHS